MSEIKMSEIKITYTHSEWLIDLMEKVRNAYAIVYADSDGFYATGAINSKEFDAIFDQYFYRSQSENIDPLYETLKEIAKMLGANEIIEIRNTERSEAIYILDP